MRQGRTYSLALNNDGQVIAWGDNSAGETNVPAGLSDVVAISATPSSSGSLALKRDGTVSSWPAGPYDGVVAGLSNVMSLAAGAGAGKGLVILSNGTMVAWGDNTYGQANVPNGLSNVVAAAVGDDHSLALMADGRLAAWGNNMEHMFSSLFNQPLYLGQATVPDGLGSVLAIAAGDMSSLVIVRPVPRIASVGLNGRNPVIRFHTALGQSYSVEYSPDLTPGSWLPLPGGAVAGTDQEAAVSDANAPSGATARFYRVKLVP